MMFIKTVLEKILLKQIERWKCNISFSKIVLMRNKHWHLSTENVHVHWCFFFLVKYIIALIYFLFYCFHLQNVIIITKVDGQVRLWADNSHYNMKLFRFKLYVFSKKYLKICFFLKRTIKMHRLIIMIRYALRSTSGFFLIIYSLYAFFLT